MTPIKQGVSQYEKEFELHAEHSAGPSPAGHLLYYSTTIDNDGEANGADTTSNPVKSEAPAETEAPSPAEIRDLDGYAFTF